MNFGPDPDDDDIDARRAADMAPWDAYWAQLTDDERKQELASMDAHVAHRMAEWGPLWTE